MPKLNDASILKQFLLRSWKDPVINTGGRGVGLFFPDIDFAPQHYLEFAEEALARRAANSRIDCVTNLKRAIECELDQKDPDVSARVALS